MDLVGDYVVVLAVLDRRSDESTTFANEYPPAANFCSVFLRIASSRKSAGRDVVRRRKRGVNIGRERRSGCVAAFEIGTETFELLDSIRDGVNRRYTDLKALVERLDKPSTG